jgi:hypothetical protein
LLNGKIIVRFGKNIKFTGKNIVRNGKNIVINGKISAEMEIFYSVEINMIRKPDKTQGQNPLKQD